MDDNKKFKPFDRVLVRDSLDEKWRADFFESYDNECLEPYYKCIASEWIYCIPYEGNEHLLGTNKAPKSMGSKKRC